MGLRTDRAGEAEPGRKAAKEEDEERGEHDRTLTRDGDRRVENDCTHAFKTPDGASLFRTPVPARRPSGRSLGGAAPESNRASLGLPDLTGFEDPLGHRPPPLRGRS
jgi:hypothetical protein